MRISGLSSFPIRPLVPPPPRLSSSCPLLDPPSLSSSSFTCIAIWFLLILATTVAIDTPASSSLLPNHETSQSPHVVVQFPSEGDQRQGLIPTHLNASRENSLLFNHFTFDPNSGRLYAGAVNRLFQLDSSLRLEEFVATGKFNKN